uniref:Ankyrin repeat-containing protein n=1 Tax=Tanacetum cinerariifolium TaxID=118510 RepID=A0A6L2JCR3_TANCI|nr:ankyrin repeat-containing protein [Tanacetum cinerariifolium]
MKKKNQRRENGTTTGVVSRSVSRAVLNGAGCYVWREKEWHHHSGQPALILPPVRNCWFTMTKVADLEANLKQFKIDQAAINSEAAVQRALYPGIANVVVLLLGEKIEKNKVKADRQFAEIMNAIKALQPPITLPVTIPHFKENSRQSFSSDEVEKEGKENQSRIQEKNVPSHGLRKQQLGGLIFGAAVEIPVGFDLRSFVGLHYDPGRGQERRTWNLGIINSNIVFQHFELLDDRHAKREESSSKEGLGSW